MSDPRGRKPPVTRRGDSDLPPVGGEVLPPERVVVGRLEAREASPREATLRLSPEDLGQLALQLGQVMRAQAEPERPPLGELMHAWLERIASRRVAPGNEARLVAHLRELFLEDEGTLTAAMVDEHLAGLMPALSPSTVNKVRGVGRQAVADAQARRLWAGHNPFALVKRQREPRRRYEQLTLAELALVQAQLRPDRRRLFRVSLHLGMRTGELLALRKSDVDFTAGVVRVHRSHGRDTTKTGKERVLPILAAIAGDLLEACQASTSELVFPGAEGDRQRVDTKLTRVLRTAMAAAGVGLTSVAYRCRRRGCGYVEEHRHTTVDRDRECPRCAFTLWPVPRVKPVRWYDLRHMCATLHHRAGADALCVALAMGHSVRGTTQAVYTHPDAAMMRSELSRWHLSA